MTKKKVSSQVLPEASVPSPIESQASPVAAPRKRASSAVKKSAAKVPSPMLPSTPPSVSKAQKSSDKAVKPVAAETQSRSPARSSARAPAPSQTRKPSRVKTSALPATPDQPPTVEPIVTDDFLIQNVNANPTNKLSDNTASETLAATASAPPLLSVAELWEQGSPIRIRIAQLRTRNALLEEQLQRLRPPVQVRGKKK